MGAESRYLKPNVVVQPHVDRWYAWSHLIPPATLALNHLERHLPIMDSYVEAPQVHAAAVRDPAMAGGPFIDLGGERTDAVAALAQHVRDKRAELLVLAESLKDLAHQLDERATGYSLDSMYASMPPILRGYVEVAYDLFHRPTLRLLEPLIYRSRLADTSGQELALFEMSGDDRPFVLSTPSLDAPDRLHLGFEFAAPEVDALARLKWEPQPEATACEALGLDGTDAELFGSFLTSEIPPTPETYRGEGVRWRYFGHACVLVESGGVSVLTDPLLAYAQGGSVPRYTFHDLPPVIDCVLITHGHQDHTMLETLLQIRHRVRTVAVPRSSGGSLQDPSLKLILESAGFTDVVEVQELDVIDLGPLVVRAMPFIGEHADLDIRAKATYLVEGAGHRLLFAADTSNVEPAIYRHVRDEVGDIDTVFVGMECDGAPLSWLYGPLLHEPISRDKDRSRTLSGSAHAAAASLVQTVRASRAYVYSMGLEPWLLYLLMLRYEPDSPPMVESDAFVAWCREAGLETDRLFGRAEDVLL